MYLTTFDPFARDLQRRLSRNPFGQFAATPPDVVRRDGDVTLRFDVPGIDPRVDRRHRGPRLSENLNAGAVEASYDNGVLEARIPVAEQAKPRKVEVRQPEHKQELAS